MRCFASDSRLHTRLGIRFRKWPVMAVTIVLFVIFASYGVIASTNPFCDVDKNHWSYGTLAKFAEDGLIEGYSEEAFNGMRPITRYEMAWAISRITPLSLSLRRMETLTRLQNEFSSELLLLSGAGSPALSDKRDTKEITLDSIRFRAAPNIPGRFIESDSGAARNGKTLSEIIGIESIKPQSLSSGNSPKTVNIAFNPGATAELSLGGPSTIGIRQGTGESDDIIARFDLKYALSQLAIFRASCELAKEEGVSSEGDTNAARATTLLGIDYNFAVSDSAFIKAGYTYSRSTDVTVPKGVEFSTSSPSGRVSDSKPKFGGFFGDYDMPGLSLDASKHTASLGVGYTFSGTTSIVLGYKLIDFHDVDPESQLPGVHRTNVATAELSIRF